MGRYKQLDYNQFHTHERKSIAVLYARPHHTLRIKNYKQPGETRRVTLNSRITQIYSAFMRIEAILAAWKITFSEHKNCKCSHRGVFLPFTLCCFRFH